MNSKFYVSFKAARLLKEKGYNEVTDYIIDEDNCMMDSHYILNEDLSEYVCSCPTKSEAIDWLESKKIIIVTELYFSRGKWSARIQRKDSWAYVALGEYYLTRLEAEEAVIIKACELL